MRKFKVTHVALHYYLFFCATLDSCAWNTSFYFCFLVFFKQELGKFSIKSN